MRKLTLLPLFCVLLALGAAPALIPARAQTNRVALLMVIKPGVKVKRASTERWVTVRKETLLGAGDSVRTDGGGQAQFTFAPSTAQVDLLPQSEYRLDAFNGEAELTLAMSLISGFSEQKAAAGTAPSLKYRFTMPGLDLTGAEATFRVRIESDGRSSVIVGSGALVAIDPGTTAGNQTGRADVPAGSGVRAEAGKGLSDVVPATSFANLDSSLDGCGALIDTVGGVILYVRTGPGLTYPRVGLLGNQYRQWIYGTTETTRWFRVKFLGGWGWVYAPAMLLEKSCAGLRKYPDSFGPEEVSKYSGLDSNAIATLTALPPPTATPKP